MTENDYSGTPLVRKLGIREGSSVALVRPPDGFVDLLGPLPNGASIEPRARGPHDVIVLFATRRMDLERRFRGVPKALTPAGGAWVAWPKKASGVETDLSFEIVQRTGLDAGLVDNKSCSVDEVWQALRFVIRRRDRPV